MEGVIKNLTHLLWKAVKRQCQHLSQNHEINWTGLTPTTTGLAQKAARHLEMLLLLLLSELWGNIKTP